MMLHQETPTAPVPLEHVDLDMRTNGWVEVGGVSHTLRGGDVGTVTKPADNWLVAYRT